MKKLLPLLFFAGLLYAEDAVDEEIEPGTEEIALLEPSYLTPQSLIVQEDIGPTLPELREPRRKSALWAAVLSGLIPGLGHVYLEDYRTAGTLFGSVGVFGGLGTAGLGNEAFQTSNLVTMQSLSFYSSYAAYRDARAYNQFVGYEYPMPTEHLSALALAPLEWEVMRKPEVWGGLLGALSLGFALQYFVFSDGFETECNARLSSSDETLFPLIALPVAIGEEAFFRGYLQSLFSEWLSPWGGIALSSLWFGVMHIPNALELDPAERTRYYTYSIPFITAFGGYFGWLTYKNRSLKESTALHTWYDFTLFLLSYSVASSAAIGTPHFAFSFSF